MSKAIASPRALLARLVKLTSTIPGLDASLMLAQYSSPLIITLLLRLAQFRAAHPRIRMGGGKASGGFGLVKLAEGWAKAAGSIGDARVIMRAFGLLPIIQWLLALHPNPLLSLKRLLTLQVSPSSLSLRNEKTLSTLQIVSLLCYYPLEHAAWLGSKGVLPLSLTSMGKASLWSVRFWALYVMLTLYKIRQTHSSLSSRTREYKAQAKIEKAEGYELQESSQSAETRLASSQSLKKEWQMWSNSVLVNAGYAPLTVHWSTPGGLWTNPLFTSVFGSMAAVGQLQAEWRKGE
ncbi:hypothetical protein P7C73_g5772, partial [Tremellales sp. Uapishka_1]